MSVPRGTIGVLIRQLGNVQAFWQDLPAPHPGMNGKSQAWIELALVGYRPKGQDEYRYVTNPNNPDALSAAVVGYRLITVAMRAKSTSAREQAYDLLERVRWKMRTVTAAAIYREAGLALVRFEPMAVFSEPTENRLRLAANMDVVFGILGGGAVDDDLGQTIATVNGPSGLIPGPGSV